MAKIESRPVLSMKVDLSLNEIECKALFELSRYNHDDVIQAIFTKLGKAYISPYESGFRTFLQACLGLGDEFDKFQLAQKAFEKK